MSRIQTATRKVFIGGGRASFSRAAAYRNEARARIKKKYPCTCYDEPETGYHETCDRHEWPDGKWSKLVNKLALLLRSMDKQEREARRVTKTRQTSAMYLQITATKDERVSQ